MKSGRLFTAATKHLTPADAKNLPLSTQNLRRIITAFFVLFKLGIFSAIRRENISYTKAQEPATIQNPFNIIIRQKLHAFLITLSRSMLQRFMYAMTSDVYAYVPYFLFCTSRNCNLISLLYKNSEVWFQSKPAIFAILLFWASCRVPFFCILHVHGDVTSGGDRNVIEVPLYKAVIASKVYSLSKIN